MSKQSYRMTDEELSEIKSISRDSTPVMKFGSYISGTDKFERANDFWKKLGDKYGFIWDTSEGLGRDPQNFIATPKPVEP